VWHCHGSPLLATPALAGERAGLLGDVFASQGIVSAVTALLQYKGRSNGLPSLNGSEAVNAGCR